FAPSLWSRARDALLGCVGPLLAAVTLRPPRVRAGRIRAGRIRSIPPAFRSVLPLVGSASSVTRTGACLARAAVAWNAAGLTRCRCFSVFPLLPGGGRHAIASAAPLA